MLLLNNTITEQGFLWEQVGLIRFLIHLNVWNITPKACVGLSGTELYHRPFDPTGSILLWNNL